MKTVYNLLLHHSNKFSINFNQRENSILELENAQTHILIPSPAAKIWRKHLFVVWFGLPARPSSFEYSQHFPHSKWILVRSNTDRRVSRQILSPPIPYGSSLSIHIADLTNIAYQFEMRISGECVSVRNADQWGMRISSNCKTGRKMRINREGMRISLECGSELCPWTRHLVLPLPLQEMVIWQSFFFREINGKKREKYTLFNFLEILIFRFFF